MFVIVDDDYEIIGVGETTEAARVAACRFIRTDPYYIKDIIDEMRLLEATPGLASALETGNPDIAWVGLKDGRIGLPSEGD